MFSEEFSWNFPSCFNFFLNLVLFFNNKRKGKRKEGRRERGETERAKGGEIRKTWNYLQFLQPKVQETPKCMASIIREGVSSEHRVTLPLFPAVLLPLFVSSPWSRTRRVLSDYWNGMSSIAKKTKSRNKMGNPML